MFRENKQEICDAVCKALQLTSNAGDVSGNRLERLEYIENLNGLEIVRPIFADGAGKNGYYDINVSWDSGTAMFIDIAEQFIRKMW